MRSVLVISYAFLPHPQTADRPCYTNQLKQLCVILIRRLYKCTETTKIILIILVGGPLEWEKSSLFILTKKSKVHFQSFKIQIKLCEFFFRKRPFIK
jgi:hypothetical protein